MKNPYEKNRSLKNWLRKRGREFIDGKLQRIPRPGAERRNSPTLDFAEVLALSGVRDACREYGTEVVSHDNAFGLACAGLTANYTGDALTFDRSTFDDAIRAMSERRRRWLVVRWTNRQRRTATARLTRVGRLIVDTLPAATGTPLEPADFERAIAAVVADRKRIAAKVVRPRPPREERRSELNGLILAGIRKAFADFQATQANQGTPPTAAATVPADPPIVPPD